MGLLALVAASGMAGTPTHKVQRGETASSIAAQHGISVEALVAANGLRDPDVVLAGTTLTIPGADGGGSGGGGSYTVRAGDTLSSIAAANGTSVDALSRANGLEDPHLIAIGRTLKLVAAARDAVAPVASEASYTVKAGDNLSSIAARFGTTPAALAAANGIGNADVVVLGTTLRIPSTTSGTFVNGGGLPTRLVNHPERLALRPAFDRWAGYYGVPTDLLQALAWMESGWQNAVVSSTKAVGIGQLMPETVDFMRLLIGDPTLDPADPGDNIRMSARYLRWLLDQAGGDVGTSLAAYYQGLRSVRSRPLYDDTKQYVAVIQALRAHFA